MLLKLYATQGQLGKAVTLQLWLTVMCFKDKVLLVPSTGDGQYLCGAVYPCVEKDGMVLD